MIIKPSDEACQRAYKYIMPTILEIYKKKQQESDNASNSEGNAKVKDNHKK